jgi:hypothetical protein
MTVDVGRGDGEQRLIARQIIASDRQQPLGREVDHLAGPQHGAEVNFADRELLHRPRLDVVLQVLDEPAEGVRCQPVGVLEGLHRGAVPQGPNGAHQIGLVKLESPCGHLQSRLHEQARHALTQYLAGDV